jgi:hypothetical protein
MKNFSLYIALISATSISCSAIKETSRHQMETGIYRLKNQQNKNHYVVIEEKSIVLHPVTRTKAGWVADTSVASTIQLEDSDPANRRPVTFINRSFDLDILTILFKYRPYISGFPNQLTTNFNTAGFMGYRSDLYILSYDKNPLNSYQRRMNHFGYSVGFFGGLGSTQMNQFVTNDNVPSEYDGVVITKGIAGLVGIGNTTFGAALGLDHLMDKNYKVWIYQAKLWTGFTVGLNLN